MLSELEVKKLLKDLGCWELVKEEWNGTGTNKIRTYRGQFYFKDNEGKSKLGYEIYIIYREKHSVPILFSMDYATIIPPEFTAFSGFYLNHMQFSVHLYDFKSILEVECFFYDIYKRMECELAYEKKNN